MKRALIPLLLIMGCHAQPHIAPGHLSDRDRAALVGVLGTQARLWNAGDIEGFMQYYWNDERMTFSSGGTTHRGWQAALQRYERRYPTPQAMGELTFSEIEVKPLGHRAAYVMGRWHVVASDKDISGLFTLMFRMIDGRWLIVHDHTSMACPS